MHTLRWKNLVAKGEFFHLVRVSVTARHPCPLHTHDFAELFLLLRGRGVHTINRHRSPLSVGDFIMVRPGDRHRFDTIDAEGFIIENLAFPRNVLSFLEKRYFKGSYQFFRAGRHQLPFSTSLNPSKMNWLGQRIERLDGGSRSRLAVEAFLLELLRELSSLTPTGSSSPLWLARAIDEFGSPLHFKEGTRGLARLAGRCPEHVNRETRKQLGVTATDFVNRRRMEYAARQLRMTSQKINDISLDCGFDNLSHFYGIFRRRFGLTPGKFRKQQFQMVQPS